MLYAITKLSFYEVYGSPMFLKQHCTGFSSIISRKRSDFLNAMEFPLGISLTSSVKAPYTQIVRCLGELSRRSQDSPMGNRVLCGYLMCFV